MALSAGLIAASSASAASLDLLSAANVRIDGSAANTSTGFSASGAGDVNGDGRDDVIVGSAGADNNSRNNSGSAYVIYGQTANTTIDLSALTAAQGFRIDGAAASDSAGYSVDGAGDVNGDGRDDVIVGAYTADPLTRTDAGASYVIFGQNVNTNLDLLTMVPSAGRGFRIDGATVGDLNGLPVAGAGDVNGDGRDDVIVGSYVADNNGRTNSGSSYVVYGRTDTTDIDLSILSAGEGFRVDGAALSDGAGYSVDGAGDVNTDGRDDVIIGASNADDNNRSNSGSSYVIYGQAANTNIDLSALTLTQGFRIDGAVAGDVSGSAVSGAGDINDDGRDDVLVGAYGADNNSRSNSGSAYVIYGQAANTNIDLSGLALTQGFRVDGAAVGNLNGYSVDAAGDVNGDGRDDLISGSFGADNNSRTDSGSAYLIYGQSANANIDLSGFATAQGFRIDGAATGDNNGISVAGSGDFNGDGRDDVITGAQTADNNSRTDSGSAYIVNSSFLPRIAYASPLLASAGAPFSEAPTAFRATPVRTASVSPALPAGLSIDPATGVISGTPTAPGITTHTVTLTDSLGVTSTRIRIGVVNAQGATGATGATGTGTQGLTGAQGPAGIQGPAGPAGRDAQVTCVVKKKGKKVKKVKVTCTVKLTAARNARLHWRLMHAGRSYAHGTSGAQDGNASIRIPGVNRLPAGRYLLRIAGRGGGISLRLN